MSNKTNKTLDQRIEGALDDAESAVDGVQVRVEAAMAEVSLLRELFEQAKQTEKGLRDVVADAQDYAAKLAQALAQMTQERDELKGNIEELRRATAGGQSLGALPKSFTVRQVLEAIDRWAHEQPRQWTDNYQLRSPAHALWGILSALRGPDNSADLVSKDVFTARLRGIVLPRLSDRVGVQTYSHTAYPMDLARVSLHNYHFRHHAEWADRVVRKFWPEAFAPVIAQEPEKGQEG